MASDVMGPFPKSKMGYRYVLVFQDLFTKWVEVIPIRTANGATIKKSFEDAIVSRWGTPEVLHTDNGTEFCNRLLEGMCKEMGILHTTNPVYHAQANATERVNRILKTMIVSFLQKNHQDWDLHLHEFHFAYNSAVHGSLKVSPAFLNFGRQPIPYREFRKELERDIAKSPPDRAAWLRRVERLNHLRDSISRHLEKAYESQAKYYDNKHRERSFAVGDLVLRRQRVLSSKGENIAAKLTEKFEGPFKIVKRLSPVVFRLVNDSGRFVGKEHIRHLKPYFENISNSLDAVQSSDSDA